MPFIFDILVASNSTWIFSHLSFATSPTSWCWLYLKLHWGPSCSTDLGQFPLLHALTVLFLCSKVIILAVFTHSRVELIRVYPHLAPDSIIPWVWTSASLSYPTIQGSIWSKIGTEDTHRHEFVGGPGVWFCTKWFLYILISFSQPNISTLTSPIMISKS